jgi:two-component system sensor histidine kinase ChiS
MSGFEVCRRLREKYSPVDLPILILTAKNRTRDLVAGFEAGANDYLAKPFDKRELMARVNTLLRFKTAVGAHDQLVALEQELDVARRIQQSILPATIPQLPQLDIQVRYRPMNSVGGDFYDFYEIDEQRLGLFVADVSGHGVPAALIAAMVKIAFSVQKPNARSASMVLTSMNHTLVDRIGKQLLTASYAYVNLETGKLFHASAGHWPLLIWKKESQTLLHLKPDGIIMGWLSEIDYASLDCDLEPGDRILLYTDAIIETRNGQGELFGEARFHRLIEEKQNLSAGNFADFLLKHLTAWSGQTNGFEDDLTLIVIDVLGEDGVTTA